MTGDTLGDVIRRIGRSVNLQSDLTLTDAQLLERFVKQRDEPAFAALLVRHGPMVLGVCRQLVRDAQEAEDAFQATFLVLARKAAGIRRQPLLAGWLYGVAYRVAVRLRGQTARRRTREQRDVNLATLAAADDGAYSDVRPLVHEEVGRLPDKYRSAVVLCYLEGKTNEEAALQLRWPVGSVKSRLARAREMLRTRLTRRGLTLSAGLLTTALVVNKASASPALMDATIRGAALFAAGDAVAGGLISARAVKLSYGVLRTMILTKAKILAALALSLGMLGGAGGLAYRSLAAEPGEGPKAAPMKTAPHDADRPKADKEKPVDKPMDDREAIQGTWQWIDWDVGVAHGADQPGPASESITWVIEADKIRVVNDSKKKVSSVSYKLDPTKKPKEIDMILLDVPEDFKGKLARCTYTLQGDILKICTSSEREGARPTEVATNKQGTTILRTFKRKPIDADKPKEEKPRAASVNVKEDDAKMTKLRQDWSAAAKKAFEAHKQEFDIGQIHAMIAIDAAHRLLRAELEQGEKKADSLAAYEVYLKGTTEIANIAKLKLNAGKIAISDVKDSEAARLEAEILLEREKAK